MNHSHSLEGMSLLVENGGDHRFSFSGVGLNFHVVEVGQTERFPLNIYVSKSDPPPTSVTINATYFVADHCNDRAQS